MSLICNKYSMIEGKSEVSQKSILLARAGAGLLNPAPEKSVIWMIRFSFHVLFVYKYKLIIKDKTIVYMHINLIRINQIRWQSIQTIIL